MESPVLIVGAGPAGLATAITLARQGIRTKVVERRSGPSPFPRATGISVRTMELMRSWGLEDEIRAGEMDVGTFGWVCDTLASPMGMPTSLGFPTPEQSAALSPTRWAAVPQDHLEPVLLAHLRTFPHVEVEFGVELIGIDQDADEVTARLRRPDDGGPVTSVRCRYVIGADGAHSAVRSSVGIPMRGPDNLGAYYTILFRAPLDRVVAERRHGLYMVQHPEAAGVFLPTDNRDRWVYSRPWDPSTETLADYPETRLTDLIRTGAGAPELRPRILRVSSFTFAAQVAERYREGSVFLVGDAAHRMTPRGGTGMNTAIHDAFDLGWKLGWVLRGWAGSELLDTYEAERRPVGVRNVERSSVEAVRRDASLDHLDDLGGRIPHAWLDHSTSTLDLVGPGLTLLTGPTGRAWGEAAAGLAPAMTLEVRGVDAAAAGLLGIDHGGAVLVRPDARAVATWPRAVTNPNADLAEAIATLA